MLDDRLAIIASARETYPAPRTEGDDDCTDASYCVAGAVVLSLDYADWCENPRFPGEGDFADVLCDLNPHLTEDTALEYATKVTVSNDNGDFGDAWDYARQAVCHGWPEERQQA